MQFLDRRCSESFLRFTDNLIPAQRLVLKTGQLADAIGPWQAER